MDDYDVYVGAERRKFFLIELYIGIGKLFAKELLYFCCFFLLCILLVLRKSYQSTFQKVCNNKDGQLKTKKKIIIEYI